MIFIVGNGRSGTHWLGAILEGHPEIRCTIEQKPMFGWVTLMAMDAREQQRLLPRLRFTYRLQAAWSAPRHYADKSHPNLWLAEALNSAFPNSVFLGIERDPFATVASMMRHRNVRKWHTKWKDLPIPNRFLGITEEVATSYDTMSLAAQCALRWRAHHDEMNRVEDSLGGRLIVIRYEALATQLAAELRRIEVHLGLKQRLISPPVQSESMNKWRSELSSEEISDISSVVGFGPPSAKRAVR